jgi:2OG-Fe(II) oxygenase superfamily
MIQLTRQGVVFMGSPADLRGLRAQFQRDHYIILPKLIEPDLLGTILKRVESAPFTKQEYNGIVAQSVIDDQVTYSLLLFLANIPEFHRLVQRITGCRRISDFQGRVYRLNPSTDDRIVWHTDVCDHRMVTLSLNLTTPEYRGGTLQIRYRGSTEILHEVRNTGLGDALLMRVAKKLTHRVLPVEGDVARTALAGWFRWGKDKKDDFHAAVRSVAQDSPVAHETAGANSMALGAHQK